MALALLNDNQVVELTDVELHQGMEEIVIRELFASQSIPNDALSAMINWPCAME
jgi:hypothetical protein